MKFAIEYLSFFVIQTDGEGPGASKRYKHYQTLDGDGYEDSELKRFLDGEFGRIAKRKVERHPGSEAAPTKIGRFEVEPGHELTANPNYNLLQRLREAGSKEQFRESADELVRIYLDTSAVRGGALVVAAAKLNDYFDEPLAFVMKCDFEPKIARIADERSLISQVEMAISARNIKSIQYPHMPEAGMLEPWELKIHQASHARYFEDFLKYVSYEKPLPQLMNEQVLGMVYGRLEEQWQEAPPTEEERQEDERRLEIWAASERRELQERWTHEAVAEASAQLIEHKPDIGFGFKLDGVSVKGQLADYGARIHLTRYNGRYVALIEGDAFQFERGMTPVELLDPEPLERVLGRIGAAAAETWHGGDGGAYAAEEAAASAGAGRDSAADAGRRDGDGDGDDDGDDGDVPW